MDGRVAVIAGATGLVGGRLLDLLLRCDAYERIILLARREVRVEDPRVRVVVLNFDELAAHTKEFAPARDYYCCLGATLTQVSREEFSKVDYDHVLSFARAAAGDATCKEFLLLTSIGANPRSRLLYNRTKGLVEQAVKQLKIPSIHIFRPSLIVGARRRKRWHEEFFKIISAFVSFFMIGTQRRFMAIDADKIAAAMYVATREHKEGVHVHTPGNIYEMAEKSISA